MEASRAGIGIVAHSWGVAEPWWAQAWLDARKELGLDDFERYKNLMCSVGPGEVFFQRKLMTSHELAIHLRETLVVWGVDPMDVLTRCAM